MKLLWLQRFMKRFEPLFTGDGKLAKLAPLYEAGDGFLFSSGHTTRQAPHVRDSIDIKRVMMFVIIALGPCALFGIYNAGHQYNLVNQIPGANVLLDSWRGLLIVLPIIFVSYLVGGLWEVLFSCVRKEDINEGFLVTGLLFPLTLPPSIPLWQVAVAISFGTVIGKEVFGGTGYNIMNPALTARAFLFFAYPGQISGDSVWTKIADKTHLIEGFTGATPLAVAASTPPDTTTVATLNHAGYTWSNMFFGLEGGSIGETSLIPILFGAVVLIMVGIGSWRIILSGIIGFAATSLLLNLLPESVGGPFSRLPLHYQLVMGSFPFGLVFMATDPVSAAATNIGKCLYGFLIGFLTILIRVIIPAFPEGTMLSILFMNVMSPMIDHFVVQAHIHRRTRRLERVHAR